MNMMSCLIEGQDENWTETYNVWDNDTDHSGMSNEEKKNRRYEKEGHVFRTMKAFISIIYT